MGDVMASADPSGFVGFDGMRVLGTRKDYIAVDKTNGIARFEDHFTSEGFRHADGIAKELVMAQIVHGDHSIIDYDSSVQSFGSATTAAQQCYAFGLCSGLAYHADVLRARVAVRDLGVSADFGHATNPSSDLDNAGCLAVARQLTILATQLSHQAGIPLPKRLEHRVSAEAATHGHQPGRAAASDERAGTAEQTNSSARPGTAGAAHANTVFPGGHDGRSR